MLESHDLDRDITWYTERLGFTRIRREESFAILSKGEYIIHLEMVPAGDAEELVGGSTAKFFVDDIDPIFNEFLKSGIIKPNQLNTDLSQGTKEIELLDLNGNTLIFIQGEK